MLPSHGRIQGPLPPDLMIRELYGFILEWMIADLQADGTGTREMVRVNKNHGTTLSQTLYFAPDGTSWTLTKSTFSFDEDLHLGKHLENIILEGVNALSIESGAI